MGLFPFFSEIAARPESQTHRYYQGPFETFEERQIENLTWDIEATIAVLPTPPCTVLEIGPGRGRVTFPLADAGFHVFGIESSPDAADQLSEVALSRGYSPQVQVTHGDALLYRSSSRFGAALLANLSINLFNAEGVTSLLEAVRSQIAGDGCFCFGVLKEKSVDRFKQYDGRVDSSFHSQVYLDAENVSRLMLMQVAFNADSYQLRQNWLVDLHGSGEYAARYHIASLTETLWTRGRIEPLLNNCGLQISLECDAQIEGGGASNEAVSFLRCTPKG